MENKLILATLLQTMIDDLIELLHEEQDNDQAKKKSSAKLIVMRQMTKKGIGAVSEPA